MMVRFWITLKRTALGEVIERDGDVLTVKYRGKYIEVDQSLVIDWQPS